MAKGSPGLTASVASGEMSFDDGTAPLWMADGETVDSGGLWPCVGGGATC